MHTIEWVRAHALDVALYLAIATVVARVVYALVARLVAPYPRLRAAVEALAAWSPDLLRGLAQLYRAVTGIDLPLPMIDARDAEIARLRAALAVAQGDLMALRATRIAVPAPVDPQAGHIRAGLLGVLLLVAAAGFATRCVHAPVLPPVSGCTPGETACDHDAKVLCSGERRWEPAGDEPCGAQHRVCAMVDGGAHCVVATDGGADAHE